ncbi:hypothetical protein FGA82_07320 [Pseudomonas fluorescens]|nr:hypothetical protein FGA82_07320 [Pseudomonas fluorescens]
MLQSALCRSEPARDAGDSVQQSYRVDAIASRLTPTGVVCTSIMRAPGIWPGAGATRYLRA